MYGGVPVKPVMDVEPVQFPHDEVPVNAIPNSTELLCTILTVFVVIWFPLLFSTTK